MDDTKKIERTANSLRAYLTTRDINAEDAAEIETFFRANGYWVSPDGATTFGIPPLGADPRWSGAYRVREPEVVNREPDVTTR